MVLVCLWKLHSRLLRTCRVRLPPCLFKGSANCTAFAVAQRSYLSKRNPFWGYLVSRGELCKLVHRSVSCLGQNLVLALPSHFCRRLCILTGAKSRHLWLTQATGVSWCFSFLLPANSCKNGCVIVHRFWTILRYYCLCSNLVCPICQVASFPRGVSIWRDS